jgi:hypothetical protein
MDAASLPYAIHDTGREHHSRARKETMKKDMSPVVPYGVELGVQVEQLGGLSKRFDSVLPCLLLRSHFVSTNTNTISSSSSSSSSSGSRFRSRSSSRSSSCEPDRVWSV